MQQFEAQWIHPSLSGGVRHRESVSATWEVAQALEIAVAAQEPHYTVLLDATKYFDRFDWDVTWCIALYFGFPVALVVLLNTFYWNLSRTFKVARRFGPWFVATNDFGQGDALTLLTANMLQTVWARMISRRYPSLQLTVYVDDRTVRGSERQSFLDALTETARFDNAAGHELNWTKTELTAAIPSDRQWLKTGVIAGRSCPVFSRTKTLGIQADHQIRCTTLMETPGSGGKSI